MAPPSLIAYVSSALDSPYLQLCMEVITFQAGYNTTIVMLGTTALGFAGGLIGVFALLRKRALMSDAIAHASLPGLATAFLIAIAFQLDARQLWLLLLGATVSGILGTLSVQLLVRYSRLHADTAIGAVLSVFFGAGIVLLSIIQSLDTAQAGGLHHFIYGQTAAMLKQDAFVMLAVSIVVAAISYLLLKEFQLVCFDDAFAKTDGWPVTWIDLTMMGLVVTVIVIGLQAVGMLLVIALLIIPPASASFWTHRFRRMIIISAFLGALSGFLGAGLSAVAPRMPAGAVIVLTSGALFLFSFLFAPARGILAVAFRHGALRLRVAEDHVLRAMFERREHGTDTASTPTLLPLAHIAAYTSHSPIFRFVLLRRMRLFGYIDVIDAEGQSSVRLLQPGIYEAARKVRNHRLWEEYLATHADVPSSHVDYSADLVEHVLASDIVEKLEQSLAAQGRKLPALEAPKSIHPLPLGRNRQ